ncbi:MAG: hypothetical protein IKN14_01835 [Clostridiales bacterium]|nr:hypothetical protein [Clostridiales bacterium]
MVKKKNSFVYAVAALATLLTGLVLIIVLGALMSAASFDPVDDDEGYISSMVSRTSVITGSGDGADKAEERIRSGMYTVGDYVIRSFTSADYLSLNRSDEQFAEDLTAALTGGADAIMTGEIIADLEGNSRIRVMADQISALDGDYEPSADIPDDPGDSFSEFNVTGSIEGPDGYTIGIRRVEGNFRATGDNVRSDFFVDRVLYQGSITTTQKDDGSRDFVMSWDTAGVTTGEHNVLILLRSSDGRGSVVDGGKINVPSLMTLKNDNVQPGMIDQGRSDSWYMIDCEDRNCYVNFVGLSDDIKVTLYDLYGDEVGTNDLPLSAYETLRGKKQDTQKVSEETGIPGISNVFYVRVRRGGECEPDDAVSYTMVQSKYVGRYNGKYVAVMDDPGLVPTPVPLKGAGSEDPEIRINDINNNVSSIPRSSIEFLPITGFLSDLSIEGGKVFPEPDKKTVWYGCAGKTLGGDYSIEAIAAEGYAARVDIVLSDASGDRILGQNETFTPAAGETTVRIRVTSFDGEENYYMLYMLSGDDKGDFTETTLDSFPESYASGLWLLHNLHPNYIFKPYDPGMSFETVLDHEDDKDRSLANINSTPAWVVSDSPVYDGGGWMTAKREIVSCFLDPRNFLDPVSVFQFEDLSFNEDVHTVEGVRKIIEGSFMDTSDYDFAQGIYEAGKKADISPYFIASKIIQEMGYNGESELCHGTLEGYEGYYNFYNIGATPDPEVYNGARINAAKFAKWGREPDLKEISSEEKKLLLPWDNIDDALTGGAMWISARYNGVGQNTLYFQKFDVIDNDDGLYEHQYAQNISMAYEEGRRFFRGYSAIDMLDGNFVFVIPVYSLMPTSFGIIPATGN